MATLPPKTISGIQEREDERVIPITRRPDGTFRKERKIRPGYTPPEDVAKYTNRVLESARPIVTPPTPATSANNTPKSKTQIKNDKRKAKRKEEAIAAELAGYPTAPKTTPSIADTTTKTMTTASDPKNVTTESTENTAVTEPVDREKKLRALNKRLRQIEQLKERQAKGETMLPEQLEKLEKMDDILAQIAELSL
ncbi:hypothetical protein FBU30_009824 [Linnemannia zychae]|nr:hypothetical protein FBU30_009824 [Linnemannia zychae]